MGLKSSGLDFPNVSLYLMVVVFPIVPILLYLAVLPLISFFSRKLFLPLILYMKLLSPKHPVFSPAIQNAPHLEYYIASGYLLLEIS